MSLRRLSRSSRSSCGSDRRASCFLAIADGDRMMRATAASSSTDNRHRQVMAHGGRIEPVTSQRARKFFIQFAACRFRATREESDARRLPTSVSYWIPCLRRNGSRTRIRPVLPPGRPRSTGAVGRTRLSPRVHCVHALLALSRLSPHRLFRGGLCPLRGLPALRCTHRSTEADLALDSDLFEGASPQRWLATDLRPSRRQDAPSPAKRATATSPPAIRGGPPASSPIQGWRSRRSPPSPLIERAREDPRQDTDRPRKLVGRRPPPSPRADRK